MFHTLNIKRDIVKYGIKHLFLMLHAQVICEINKVLS